MSESKTPETNAQDSEASDFSTEESDILAAVAAHTGKKAPEKEPKQPEGNVEPEKEAEGTEEADKAEKPADDEPENKTIKALAEKLGVDAADLYKVKIPMSNGEVMSLGQLKDAVQSGLDVDSRTQELTQKQIEYENQRLKERAEVTALLSKVQHAITPEMVEQTRAERDQLIARERQALLEAVPEWRDAETYTRDRTALVEFVGEYGVSEAEFSNVTDHRLVKLLRDAHKLKQALSSANAEAKKLRSVPKGAAVSKPAKSVSSLDSLIKQAKASKHMDQKIAAADALIGGL